MVETIENRTIATGSGPNPDGSDAAVPEAADRTIRHGLYHQSVFADAYTRITRRHRSKR